MWEGDATLQAVEVKPSGKASVSIPVKITITLTAEKFAKAVKKPIGVALQMIADGQGAIGFTGFQTSLPLDD